MVADLDRDSNTALHLAVEKGHYNIVKLILNTGDLTVSKRLPYDLAD